MLLKMVSITEKKIMNKSDKFFAAIIIDLHSCFQQK